MVIKQAAGSRQQAAGSRQQAAGSRQQAAVTDFNCTSQGRVHDVDLFSDFFFNSDLNTHSNVDLSTYSTTDLHTDSILDSRCCPDFGFDFDLRRDSLQGTNQVRQSYLNSRKKPLALSVMLLSGLFAGTVFTSVHAALSATTANTIQGTKPYLLLPDGVTKLTSLDELLGFSMPKQDGTPGMEQIDVSMSGAVLTAPSGMTYNDVVALVVADGAPQSLVTAGVTVGDGDGDTGLPLGSITATWKNGSGIVVPASNLGQALSVCEVPYTLELRADNIKAETTYGAPYENNYTPNTSKTYTFISSDIEICYLQPDMTVKTGSAGVNIKHAAGYNVGTWAYDSATSTHKGFKKNAGFPTTGFDKAEFRVIGPGNDQSNYRCNLSGGNWITKSGVGGSSLGEGCLMTYNSAAKPTTAVTINLDYFNGSSWISGVDSYTINAPSKWAIFAGQLPYGNNSQLSMSTNFPALDACRTVGPNASAGTTTWLQAAGQSWSNKAWRQQYMYRRDELTNSPLADRAIYPESSAPVHMSNYFSRDVGTFMSEWGDVYNYAGSGWTAYYYYWTAEAWSNDSQANVYTLGHVSHTYPDSYLFVALCRGE